MEILGRDSSGAVRNIFDILPPLSCRPITVPATIVIDESESDRGQLFIISLRDKGGLFAAVSKVDLATGVCTAQPSLLFPPGHDRIGGCTAGRLLDGRIVCAFNTRVDLSEVEDLRTEMERYTMTQVLEPPPHGSPSGSSWQWRELPGMSGFHGCGGGCVLSDGRFAVFGGGGDGATTSSSEVLILMQTMRDGPRCRRCMRRGVRLHVRQSAGASSSPAVTYALDNGRSVRGRARAMVATSVQPSSPNAAMLYGQCADVNSVVWNATGYAPDALSCTRA